MTTETQTTALVAEAALAPEADPIPADLADWEKFQLAMADLNPGRPYPLLAVKDDTDAERLMARIKALRLEATKAAAPIDAEVAERRAHIEALRKAMARLEEDVTYLLGERVGVVDSYAQAEALYRPSLDAYLLAKIAAKPDGEKSLVLQSGKLLSNSPGPKWSWGDEKALGLWAKQHLPAVVKEEPVVNKAELKKLVEVEGATGNVFLDSGGDGEPIPVPGVKVTTPPREITLEVTL